MQAAKKMYGEAKLMQMLAWAFADCLGITVADPEGIRLNPPPPPPPPPQFLNILWKWKNLTSPPPPPPPIFKYPMKMK